MKSLFLCHLCLAEHCDDSCGIAFHEVVSIHPILSLFVHEYFTI